MSFSRYHVCFQKIPRSGGTCEKVHEAPDMSVPRPVRIISGACATVGWVKGSFVHRIRKKCTQGT